MTRLRITGARHVITTSSSSARIAKKMHLALSLALLCAYLTEVCHATSGIPAPRYVLDLDAAPQDRWTHIVADYSSVLKMFLQEVKKIMSPEVVLLASFIGDNIDKYMPPPYNLEMVGVSINSGIHLGDVVLVNIIYEATAFNKSKLGQKACTSIVAEAPNGTVYHARNLDYSLLPLLQNLTVTVDFQSGGRTVYTGTTFVGYVGLLTGQRPHAYTITLDERDQGDWWMNLLEAFAAGTSAIAAFHIRDTLADTSLSFNDAIEKLAYEPLVAPCYLIVGGVESEGVVITRNRIAALDIWRFDVSEGRWFLVETNYDHWTTPPPSDDRRDPAIKAMNELGRGNVSATSMFRVLSTPPILNDKTLYTVTMSASIPELYNAWIRFP